MLFAVGRGPGGGLVLVEGLTCRTPTEAESPPFCFASSFEESYDLGKMDGCFFYPLVAIIIMLRFLSTALNK